jgi:putative ABC transport system substrate-binding protein
MASVGDAVGTGLVASLGRPGGNVTGSSTAAVERAGKLVELIREILPTARRLGVLANAMSPLTVPFLAQSEVSAHAMGIEIRPILVGSAEELDTAFALMARERLDAVIVLGLLLGRHTGELALRHRLPAVSLTSNKSFIEAGGLMSYGASFADLHRETAGYVDRILRGSKPADLPVRQPNKFELIVNLKTARTLGLTIPPAILVLTDEAIE